MAFNATAASLHENNEGSDAIELSSSGLLQAGENVLAIQVLNESLASSDLSMIPTVIGIAVETTGIVEPAHDVEINEVFAGSGPSPGFIEVHNEGAQAVDLSGYKLVSSPVGAGPYAFPSGTNLAPGSSLAVLAANLPFVITNGAQWFGLVTSDLRFGVPLPVRLRLAIGSALDPFP